ncbi:MAG TPA: shikimate dehydrogenase [Candidatus Norongarragalinales archaeon]|nr:shikimate dehydrogenase [Candidatus Norongarragalinales archaeon]
MTLNGKTQLTGVVADPVEHSMSPPMHNANFASLGLNFAYVAMRVKPCDLKEAIEGLKALNFIGFNVSVPHKQAILPYLDRLDDFAQNCGAVNTVVLDDGSLAGSNTDGPGAVLAAKEAKADISEVVVVGAGGAGHAVAYAMAAEGSKVTLLNRTQESAKNLAEKIRKKGFDAKAAPWDQLGNVLKESTFLAQTTRVGMNENRSVVPAELLHKDLTVLDAVYSPLQTRLVQDAKKVGCLAITGERMLLHQAVLANEMWTGRKADVHAMEKALYDALKVRK